uniref:Uncharacterized protein n=1 Tax=Piliocolobus tephrosceles TaxID=591936 RepID=A0A8C9IWA6_9PRIM
MYSPASAHAMPFVHLVSCSPVREAAPGQASQRCCLLLSALSDCSGQVVLVTFSVVSLSELNFCIFVCSVHTMKSQWGGGRLWS